MYNYVCTCTRFQDHIGRVIVHVTSSAYSICPRLASGPVRGTCCCSCKAKRKREIYQKEGVLAVVVIGYQEERIFFVVV